MATNNAINLPTGATGTVVQGQGVGSAPAFTATPSVTSISFGGTALANYVEGTWTPAITFGGGNTGLTYTLQNGVYRRIGNTVFIYGYINIANVGSSTGNVAITGLPVTTASNVNFYPFIIPQFENITFPAGFTSLFFSINTNATTMLLYRTGSGKTVSSPVNNTVDTISNGFILAFNGSYLC